MRTLSQIECDSCFKGLKENCEDCGGTGYLEIRFTMNVPEYLSLQYLLFEPVSGLFGVFLLDNEIIGVGNIECRKDSLFVYDLQPFKGLYGYVLMIKAMKNMENICFIEGI